jgi:hypothetical protein
MISFIFSQDAPVRIPTDNKCMPEILLTVKNSTSTCILCFDLVAKFEYVDVSKHVLEKEALVLTVWECGSLTE